MEYNVDDKFQDIFQAYSSLQSESYEFIVRTIAMHNWLKEAYRLIEENPELSAEQMYMTLQPSFENVYDHLFALFLRPYRILMFPFGEYTDTIMENMAPKSMAGTYLGLSRIWESLSLDF